MTTSGETLLITGSAGRLGRGLRLLWPSKVCGLTPHWFGRHGTDETEAWHIRNSDPPSCLQGAVVLHLAAVLRGTAAELAANASMATALCAAAKNAGARHILLASTAAVYRPGAQDIPESQPPHPANPYGAAKLAAEHAAAQTLASPGDPDLTILRIGNVAGADALLGCQGPALLDPVKGQSGGPLRSYIGPQVLAQVLAELAGMAARGATLPRVLNIAQSPVVAMGDLLTAAQRDWRFGPPRDGVVPRVGLDANLLGSLVRLPPATATGIVADLDALKGRWP